jgi:hypothetical protein
MGKDKNKIRNNEEEIKMGENSIRKLVEVYSYNVVVDQFFMTTSKKIVEIDKILRNLKNKTGSAFVYKFLYDHRNELSNLCTTSKYSNINYFEEKPKIEKRFLKKKRRKVERKNYLIGIDKEEKGAKNIEKREKHKEMGENDLISLRERNSKPKKSLININSFEEKSICTHLLLNSYANKNNLEYLPDKTIEERINSMREKVLFLFPQLETEKSNEISSDNDEQKKKENSSVNESNSTKEFAINSN